eukprot:TRINITY_DN8210_c0_g1_i3.p1 TRINITY_DN8210_c0_g1~~TRINITY_DN8210_c0_g1_i3.p1  ORF type:complete len:158 (+),score=44.69 TRINITY_DN8210_c0_g1_i3:359-832(+)
MEFQSALKIVNERAAKSHSDVAPDHSLYEARDRQKQEEIEELSKELHEMRWRIQELDCEKNEWQAKVQAAQLEINRLRNDVQVLEEAKQSYILKQSETERALSIAQEEKLNQPKPQQEDKVPDSSVSWSVSFQALLMATVFIAFERLIRNAFSQYFS